MCLAQDLIFVLDKCGCMICVRVMILISICSSCYGCKAQAPQSLQKIPVKYIVSIDNKIDKHSSCITKNSKKVLAKLSRWEKKINALLQKVNPEAAAKLFGCGYFKTCIQNGVVLC